MTWQILTADVLAALATLPDESVQTVVTSPPYWGLRDYGDAGQLGLEPTPEAYVERLVGVFREIRRVLRPDGTVWLNLGDSYAAGSMTGKQGPNGVTGSRAQNTMSLPPRSAPDGLKPKDLVGIPWRVAFALQADGWYLRSDIIWAKPNPMPESVTDRPTKAHEYMFLLTKSARYYYDADAVREAYLPSSVERARYPVDDIRSGVVGELRDGMQKSVSKLGAPLREFQRHPVGANLRSVWNIATEPFPEAHFATFPKALVVPCVKAGSKPGDTVLDPFAGSGTVGVVALRHGRSFVGIELNPDYAEMARERIRNDAPLWNHAAEVV